MAQGGNGKWVTIKGSKVFIEDGQSVSDAFKARKKVSFHEYMKGVKKLENEGYSENEIIKKMGEKNAKYADDEHTPTALSKVKEGDFFKLSNKPNAKVYVRREYDKAEKAYWCEEFYDVNNGRYMKGKKTVYTGFTF